MYFLLSAARRFLNHIEKAVFAILLFVGCKLLIEAFRHPLSVVLGRTVEISPAVSLTVVVAVLAIGLIASLVFPAPESG
jgi:tellurite resistance protein TerC